MASIQRRRNSDGTTSYKVSVRRAGHPPVYGSFRTRKEADAFARTVEGDLGKHARLLGGQLRRHKLSELIDWGMARHAGRDPMVVARAGWWRDHYGERTLDQAADIAAEGRTRLLSEPALQGGATVTPTDRKRSASTVDRYVSTLSALFRRAIREQQFGFRRDDPLPTAGLERAKATSRHGRKLSDEERARLLAAADADVWPGMASYTRLALATGARRGELLKLTWADVDLVGGSVLFRATKNDDDRAVPLIPHARAAVQAWQKRGRRTDSPLVFPSPRAPTSLEPVPPVNIEPIWRRVRARAGIEDFRLHDLRHSCGSYLAGAGLSAFQIAAILGHRSGPAMSQRYVHLAAKESAQVMEQALGGLFGDEQEERDR